MCDNKHRLLSAVCSPGESLVFLKHWQHLTLGIMCQTIDSLEYRCTVKAATHVSSPKAQINIFFLPPFFKWYPAMQIVLVVFAKVLRSLPVGFMPPAQHNESEWGRCCAQRMESPHFKN